MAKAIRAKSDSVKGMVDQFTTASKVLQPSRPLNSNQMSHFKRIVNDRETGSWSDNHLHIATELAITYALIESATTILDSEGMMLKNDRGTMVTNPMVSARLQLSGSALHLNKALGLSASQKGLSGSPQAKRNEADARARGIISKISEDDLL
jgi:hypothetical protein